MLNQVFARGHDVVRRAHQMSAYMPERGCVARRKSTSRFKVVVGVCTEETHPRLLPHEPLRTRDLTFQIVSFQICVENISMCQRTGTGAREGVTSSIPINAPDPVPTYDITFYNIRYNVL